MSFTSLAFPLQNAIHTKDHTVIRSTCLKFPVANVFCWSPLSSMLESGSMLVGGSGASCLLVCFSGSWGKEHGQRVSTKCGCPGKGESSEQDTLFTLLNSWAWAHAQTVCLPSPWAFPIIWTGLLSQEARLASGASGQMALGPVLVSLGCCDKVL